MCSSSETFRNIAGGIQGFAIAIAFLVVGGWTIYTFDVTETRDKAQAELTGLRQAINQEAVVTVELEANQALLPNDDSYFINVASKVFNGGNRGLRLDLGGTVIAAALIQFGAENELIPSDIHHSGVVAFADSEQTTLRDLPFIVLDAQDSATLPFWIKVDGPGLYLIEFRAGITDDDLTSFQDQSRTPGQPFATKGRAYVVVS